MPVLHQVTVVCHQFPPWRMGGLAEYAERCLHHLHRRRGDLRLRLYTMNHPGDQPRHGVSGGVPVVRPRMPRWLGRRLFDPHRALSARGQGLFAIALIAFNLGVFLGLCRGRRRGSVIAVHDWQSTPAGILAATLLRLPVVYHVHNTEQTMAPQPDVADPLRIIGTCQRLMAALAALVVVPTPEMGDLLVRHGFAAHKIRVVPHGYEDPPGTDRDAPADRAATRAELLAEAGFPADSLVLVFAGRLSPVKGVHTLLRALPDIARWHPAARLFLLGTGLPGTDQDAVVDRLVAQLGIADRTRVYHRHLSREQVRRHYLAADLCLFPSTYEPFGLVSVEAMALGTPVLLGSGFSATIGTDGVRPTALRLTADRPEELARLAGNLLADAEYAAELGARGRRHVERSFGWSASVDATVAVYEEAVTARRAGRPVPAPGKADRPAVADPAGEHR
ncbi:glycosyltransferase family 4 protein [Polymorphospora sp. NPDC050346]|uniref:glycosyltransferase family 4 protein n=1 Tax=Polymorphospora sp. NPDC050346 TaxID=3155780 RepID=UPI0033E1C94F